METKLIHETVVTGHKFRIVFRSNEDGVKLEEFNHFGSIFIPFRDMPELLAMLDMVPTKQSSDTV